MSGSALGLSQCQVLLGHLGMMASSYTERSETWSEMSGLHGGMDLEVIFKKIIAKAMGTEVVTQVKEGWFGRVPRSNEQEHQ